MTRRILAAVCWLPLLLNLVVWGVIRRGDAIPIPTLISYGPRWIWLCPALALAPLVLFRRKRAVPLTAALFVAVVPIMQFEVPALRAVGQKPATASLTVMTMNAGMLVSVADLERVVLASRADIVALQEWRARGNAAPRVAGYTTSCDGSLCVVSRFPMRAGEALDRRQIGGHYLMATKTHIQAPGGEITLANVHLETVRDGVEAVLLRRSDAWRQLAANLAFRELESRVVAAWAADTRQPLIVAGDFNLPTDSTIYRSTWQRWSNAFSVAGWGFGWSKYTSKWGIRIDHVLVDEAAWTIVDARVGPAAGSDHRPVVVRLRRPLATPHN